MATLTCPSLPPAPLKSASTAAVEAFNWAERYQGPVILMSEMSLAERTSNIPKPDLNSLNIENRQIYSGRNGYMRYEGDTVSPMPIPGQPGSYVANGSEHDPLGDTTHLPIRHIQMTERRFNKLKLLANGSYESENTDEPIALMPWGGSKGPSLEAYRELMEQGIPIGWYYTMFLNPLPSALLEELRSKELVLVPELNYQGQWASVLRSQGVNAEAITQYTGLPFKVRDLVKWVGEKVKSMQKGMVTV